MNYGILGIEGGRETKNNEILIDINWNVLQCIDVFDMLIKPRILTPLMYTNHNPNS